MIEALPFATYVATAGPAEQMLWVSPQVKELIGVEPETWRSNPMLLLDMIHEQDLGRVLREQANSRAMGEPLALEYRVTTVAGRVIWIDHRTRPLAVMGSDALWMGTLQDITERKQVESELRALAYLDELTGLYNRRGFFKVAEQQLRLTQRSGRGAVLLYLDIDALKDVNDNIGYDAGDRVLLETARLLRASFRDTDVISRTGGDEFTVWAVETDGDRGEVLLHRLQERLGTLPCPAGSDMSISFSLGYAFCEPSEQVTVHTLLQRADAEMYRRRRAEVSV
jgi:diguanylate cyclase (GGDEF)-like protein/PAS domain S-box-containing protein